jgi:hypothetical protein
MAPAQPGDVIKRIGNQARLFSKLGMPRCEMGEQLRAMPLRGTGRRLSFLADYYGPEIASSKKGAERKFTTYEVHDPRICFVIGRLREFHNLVWQARIHQEGKEGLHVLPREGELERVE